MFRYRCGALKRCGIGLVITAISLWVIRNISLAPENAAKREWVPGNYPPSPRATPAESHQGHVDSPDEAILAFVRESGEANSRSIDWLIAAAKTKEQLPTSDIQSLLAFISSPKPGDLTDGEWEERVNVILNLLRRQTEDFNPKTDI